MKRAWPNSWIDPALGLMARSRARRAYQRLLRDAEQADSVQEMVLLQRIARARASDFGREHHFQRLRGYEDFRAAVPIRDYEQLRPWIDRVMAGDERALLGPSDRVLMFAMTSGSTDRPKYIPVTRLFIREYRRGWNAFGLRALLDHPDAFLRPILQVTSPLDVEKTARGVPCGSISGLLAREQSAIVRRYYAAPPEVSRIADAEARYYTIMRFAVPKDVAWIVTASPATPLKLAHTANDHAERLIRDLRDGSLTPPSPLRADIAKPLEKRLRPAPDTAARLEELLSRNGVLRPRDYWRLSFLANWTGGTLALHLRDFPAWFGETPVRDIGLLATEGRVSIGLESGTPVTLMDPGAAFFEFAEGTELSDRSIRRCHELDIGGVYRVIMTTSTGLFRYDLGDCVRVAGRQGRTPLLEFLHRGSRTSSMTGEKLTEWQVTRAVELALAKCEGPALDFVLCPTWDAPPFYSLYVERDARRSPTFAEEVDRALIELNMEYAGKRSSGRLGPVRLVDLPDGALNGWNKRCIETRRSNEQYKHQYLLTTPGQDADLVRGCQPMSASQGQVAGTG